MKRIIVLIGMVFVFLACTGDFKEINTDKSGVTDEDLQADYNEHGIRLGIIQQGMDGTAPCGDIPMSMFSRRYISRRMPHVIACLPFSALPRY